jgi:hypothetical protein
VTKSRSRQPLPVWALLVLVLAGLAWQAWNSSDDAPADGVRMEMAPQAQAEAVPSVEEPREGESRDLSVDERRGGHTLARHVGRTDDQLRDRLGRERNISAASTYTDRSVAERVVALALAQNARRVEAWVARDGSRPNLAIDYRGLPDVPIGRSVVRGRDASVTCRDAVVVLRWDHDDYYVLTSYPEVRR